MDNFICVQNILRDRAVVSLSGSYPEGRRFDSYSRNQLKKLQEKEKKYVYYKRYDN